MLNLLLGVLTTYVERERERKEDDCWFFLVFLLVSVINRKLKDIFVS